MRRMEGAALKDSHLTMSGSGINATSSWPLVIPAGWVKAPERDGLKMLFRQTASGLRAEAPFLTYGTPWITWLRQIGELLAGLDAETQNYWIDQYGTLIVIKYGGVEPLVALGYVRSYVIEAEVRRAQRTGAGRPPCT